MHDVATQDVLHRPEELVKDSQRLLLWHFGMLFQILI